MSARPCSIRFRALGGTIELAFTQYHSIRAHIPPLQAEQIAALAGVIFIQPAQEALTMRMPAPASVGISSAPNLAARAALQQGPITNAINISEGDQTHRANLARTTFGVSGAGIKVGVLSDGVNSLASLQSSGDLPAVTVLPGQAGNGDEGSAMLRSYTIWCRTPSCISPLRLAALLRSPITSRRCAMPAAM